MAGAAHAMVDFSNRAEAREWLNQQSADVRVVLVARHALRLLPLIDTAPARQHANFLSLVALPCFRATAVSLAIGKHRMFAAKFQASAQAATNVPFTSTVASVAAHFAARAAANPTTGDGDGDGTPAAFFTTDASRPEEPSFILVASVIDSVRVL